MESWAFASPELHQVPIDVTTGWAASPVFTRYPFRYPLNSWVDWSNVGKVSCSRKQQQQHQSVLSGDSTCNLSISRPMPWLLGYAATHRHRHSSLPLLSSYQHLPTHNPRPPVINNEVRFINNVIWPKTRFSIYTYMINQQLHIF